MRYKFFTWKTPTNCRDKKPRDLRPTNLNPLFEVKLHRFTWTFYPKDLLYNTYNLIHVRDATIPYCSIVNPSVSQKGLQSLTNNSKIQIFELKNMNGVAIRFFSQGVPPKNSRSLNNLLGSL